MTRDEAKQRTLAARETGNFDEALRLAADLRLRFPDDDVGYVVGAAAARELQRFDEAEAILNEGVALFPDDPALLSELAWTVRAHGQLGRARDLAKQLREQFPGTETGYRLGAICESERRNWDEAKTIAEEGQRRFAAASWPLIELAVISRAQGRNEQAADISTGLRERFPDSEEGYRIGAPVARDLGRLEQSRGIAEQAIGRFAAASWPLAEMARTYAAQGRKKEALRLAAELRARFPDDGAGYQIGASSARELGRLDEADAIASRGLEKFTGAAWPLVELSWTRRAQQRREEAGDLATRLRQRFPENPAGYQLGVICARELGRLDEGDELAEIAMVRFPSAPWPILEAAVNAFARGDFAGAMGLAWRARERFPDNPAAYRLAALYARESNELERARDLFRDAAERFSPSPWAAEGAAAMEQRLRDRDRTRRLIAQIESDPTLRREIARTASRASRRKAAIVIGMHRAGTSLCAKIVQQLGCDFGGPLMRRGPGNADGYFELIPVVEFHRALAKRLNADWDTPWLARAAHARALGLVADAEVAKDLREIVSRQLSATKGIWAFKDPRTTRFLPLWRRVLDELGVEPIWILAVRDPRAVCQSLMNRGNLPFPEGALLWTEHYLDALRHLGPRISAVVHYETWFSRPRVQIDSLARALGAPSDELDEAAEMAIRSELRHVKSADTIPTLDIALSIHNGLAVAAPNLDRLQRQASALWFRLQRLSATLD